MGAFSIAKTNKKDYNSATLTAAAVRFLRSVSSEDGTSREELK